MGDWIEAVEKLFRGAAFLGWLTLAGCAVAEKPWPKRVAEAKCVETEVASLPLALQQALLVFDEFTQGGDKLADKLGICRIDLNGDGRDEFVVWSNQSYSGGPMIFVFEKRRDEFKEIATVGGGMYFAERKNGYFEIVTQSRAGGGMETRESYCLNQGKYHLTRIADYRLGESDGEFVFVKERDPKEYDQ